MKRYFRTICLSLFLLGGLTSFLSPANAFSLLNDDTRSKLFNQEDKMRAQAGFESTNQEGVATIVATAIRAFIGLLGIIFVVLIVASGYNWMTAGGDEAKITKAKNTISRAVIGLVIVLAAYSITFFVFSNLDSVIDSGGSASGST